MNRVTVFDRWGGYVGELDEVRSAVLTQRVNGEESLDVVSRTRVEKGWRLLMRDGMGTWHEFVAADSSEIHEGGPVLYSTWAEASTCELRGDYVVDRNTENATARDALSAALSSSRWTVGNVDDFGTNSLHMLRQSAWDAVCGVVETWGGELRRDISVNAGTCSVTERKLSLVSALGSNNGLRFEYGHNMTGVRRTVSGDVVTAAYAWGKGVEVEGQRLGISGVTPDGLPYVHDDEAMSVWGRKDAGGNLVHTFGEYVDASCDDAAKLMASARAWLDEHKAPMVSYKADVTTFAAAGTDLSACSIGDVVQVVDRSFDPPLRVEARVVELRVDLMSPAKTNVTLGNFSQTIADDIVGLKRYARSMTEMSAAWDAASSASSGFVERVIGELNDLFDGAGGYVNVDPATGITVMDAATREASTMAMQLNGAGFRIANSKRSDGEWAWRTFGTGAGFAADEIVSGFLSSDRIAAGSITASKLLLTNTGNYWNLVDGADASGNNSAYWRDGWWTHSSNGTGTGWVYDTGRPPGINPGDVFEMSFIAVSDTAAFVRPRLYVYSGGKFNPEANPRTSYMMGMSGSLRSYYGTWEPLEAGVEKRVTVRISVPDADDLSAQTGYVFGILCSPDKSANGLTKVRDIRIIKMASASLIVDGSVTADKITANDIEGPGGRVNLRSGTFRYSSTTTGDTLEWDGQHLTIKAEALNAMIGGGNLLMDTDVTTDAAVSAPWGRYIWDGTATSHRFTAMAEANQIAFGAKNALWFEWAAGTTVARNTDSNYRWYQGDHMRLVKGQRYRFSFVGLASAELVAAGCEVRVSMGLPDSETLSGASELTYSPWVKLTTGYRRNELELVYAGAMPKSGVDGARSRSTSARTQVRRPSRCRRLPT